MPMLRKPSTTIISSEQLYDPQYTTSEVLKANFDLANRQSTTNSLYRSWLIDDAQSQGEKLAPEEINKRYNINAKEPLTESAAITIQSEQQEVQRLQNIIAKGPQSFWGGTLPGFVGAIAGGLADPIDLPVGIATGAAFKSMALGLKAMTQVGQVTKLGAKGAFAADVLGNTVSNAFTEAFNYNATKKEQMALGADEAFRNVVMTSFAFTGAMHGAGAIMRKLGKIGENAIVQLGNTAEAALAVGANPKAVLDVVIPVLEKDLEIDLPMQNAIKRTFGDQADDILKENSDVTTVRDYFTKNNVDPEIQERFIAILKEEGYEMRKTYLLDAEPKPELPPEKIAEIEAKLSDPSNREDFNPDADEILKRNEPITDEAIAVLGEDITRLQKYDVDFEQMKDMGDLKENPLYQADFESKTMQKQAKMEMEALQSFTACVFGRAIG